jgi:hypothetical protein
MLYALSITSSKSWSYFKGLEMLLVEFKTSLKCWSCLKGVGNAAGCF